MGHYSDNKYFPRQLQSQIAAGRITEERALFVKFSGRGGFDCWRFEDGLRKAEFSSGN